MGLRVLVVDDAAFMRLTLKNILLNADFEVEEAVDGEDAIHKYKELNPDVVTMDITMPNKDGLEAAMDIREFDPEAVILMCTALGQESMVKKAVKIGVKDFIVKPFEPDRVIEAIQTALGQ